MSLKNIALVAVGLLILRMELVTLLALLVGGVWLVYKLVGAVAEHGNW